MISSSNQEKNEHALLSGEEKVDAQEKQSTPTSAIAEQVITKNVAESKQVHGLENQHPKTKRAFPASAIPRRPARLDAGAGSGVQAAEGAEVELKPSNVELKPSNVPNGVELKPSNVELKPSNVELKPSNVPNVDEIGELEGMMERTDEFAAIKKTNRARSSLVSEVLTEEDKREAEGIPTIEMNTSSSAVENILLYRGQHFYVKTTIRPGRRPRRDPLRKPSGHTAMMPKILPLQKERVAESDTRLMPIIDVQDLKPKKRVLFPNWAENVMVVFGVILSVVVHAVNMFNYPRYEMDEGTYMSAAWAVLNGKIYPYAYGYGHPPFAWLQLAGLVKLVGGFFLFGNAINTGRVLMLSYTLVSTLLVYLIMRKISGSRAAALLAMALFAFSPMAVTYQRLVLLDNIATFWFLLSVYLLTMSRSRLSLLVLSAICFGLAMLSKEVLILFMPGMIYGVWLHATQFQRKFALVAFIYTFVSVASLYILLAVLKGELFPTHWLPWDNHQHLSLIGTFLEQTGRGQNEGKFSQGWQAWYGVDPLFMILGLVGLAFNVAIGWWNRKHLLFAILAMSYWVLLIRGGVVFPFYFIPLIPMMAINSALMINTVAGWIGKYVRFDLFRVVLVVCILATVLLFDVGSSNQVYNGNQTKVQTEAMAWIRANVPRNSYVIMNSYLYMDLRAPGGAAVGDGSVFPNAEVYINIATDPVLLTEVHSNWDRVDYIIADSQIETYIKGPLLPRGAKFMKQALASAGPPCAIFRAPGYEIDAYCVKHQSPQSVAMTSPNQQITVVDRRSLLA